jgi:hypothetical protein
MPAFFPELILLPPFPGFVLLAAHIETYGTGYYKV